jgi:ribosome-associated toxin RatA of RatAB toxin-antitoxin module
MADRTESRITVDAVPSDVLAVICDFASYPEWTGAVKRATVEQEEDGWPREVAFVLDAGVIKDAYTLAYEWDVADDGTGTVSWSLVRAEQLLRGLDGSYELAAASKGGTEVTYRLTVDVKIPMLGLLKRKAEKGIIETALTELKKRAEA